MPLSEEQVREYIDPIVDILRRAKYTMQYNKGVGQLMPMGEKPCYYDGYDTFKDWKDQIAVHTIKGTIPYKILEVKAPCQSDEELKYVIANYKQTTLPVGEEFLNTIGRGLHSSNWSITYQEDEAKYETADGTFQKYMEEDIAKTPLRMSYEAWWRFVLPSIKLNDSMGVVAFETARPQMTTLDEYGNEVIAGDTLPEPYPCYYGCEQVLTPIGSPVVVLDTGEKSMVNYGRKNQKLGFIWKLFDKDAIYYIKQVGDFKDYTYDVSIWLTHNLGFIPVIYLQGRPVYMDGKLVWQSQFLLVTDILDEIIMDNSNLRSIKASSAYPQKVTIGNPCRASENYNGIIHNCEQGYVLNFNNDGGYHKCAACKGTGLAIRTSPLNTILIDTGAFDPLNNGDQIKPSDALHFAEPSVDHPKNLRDEINHAFDLSKSILHIKTTNQAVQGDPNGTATEWALDEKSKYAFLSLPVDQIFDIGEFGEYCIGGIRYGKDFKPPTVHRPVTYDFNSESDYLNNIAQAQKTGAPPIVTTAYLTKYLKAVYYDSEMEANIYDLILATDRIISLSQDEINMKLSRNLIAPWESVLHDSAYTLITDLLRADPKFFEKGMDEQKKALIAAAQLATPIPAPTGRMTTAAILGAANAPPVTP